MKKIIYCALFVLAAVAAVCSCREKPQPDPETLAAPVPVVDSASLSESSFTVLWEPVENAVSYTYVLDDGAEETVNTTSAVFSGLSAATEYTVRVKADASDDSEEYLDSEWAGIVVTTLEEKEPDPEDPVALDIPQLTVSGETETSFVVEWTAVSNAVSYAYTINDGSENTTGDISVEFADLAPATEYTVRVKAVADPKNGRYTDSEWAVITAVTLEAEEPGKLTAPVLEIVEQTETSFVIGWTAIEGAVSYAYTLNDGAEVSTEELAVSFTDLAAGDYSVKVKAVGDGSDWSDSDWAGINVSVTGGGDEPEPEEGISKWYGTYEVTSTATVEMGVDGNNVTMNLVQEPRTFNITIAAYDADQDGTPEDSLAMLTGWSAWMEEAPGLMQLLPDGSLAMLSGVSLGEDSNNPGMVMTWLNLCGLYGLSSQGIPDGYLNVVTGPAYSFIFTDENGVITSAPASGELRGGGTFTTVGAEIFGLNSSSGNISIYNLPWEMPAGEFTLRRTGDASSSDVACSREIRSSGHNGGTVSRIVVATAAVR